MTKADTFSIPGMYDFIDKVGKAKYVTKFYLLNLHPGMKDWTATFQRLINKVIQDVKDCEAYTDDVIIYNDTWESHLRTIRERLSGAKLIINLSKSEFGRAQVTYLGHVLGQSQVKPVCAKLEAIAHCPRPENKEGLMRFLGFLGWLLQKVLL